jgi:hypothetical protein
MQADQSNDSELPFYKDFKGRPCNIVLLLSDSKPLLQYCRIAFLLAYSVMSEGV